MDPNSLTARLRAGLRMQKQLLVEREGIGTDIPPTIVTLAGGMLIGAYPLGETGGAPETAAVAHTAIALSRADTAVFITEHYVEANGGSYEHLPQRFASGDPAVLEAIAFTVVPRRGDVRVAFDPYHYHGKEVVWTVVEEPSPVLARDLAHVAQRHARPAYAAQGTHGPGPALGPGSQLHLLGTQKISEDTAMVHMALMQTCPCGSGKAMNQCCAIRN